MQEKIDIPENRQEKVKEIIAEDLAKEEQILQPMAAIHVASTSEHMHPALVGTVAQKNLEATDSPFSVQLAIKDTKKKHDEILYVRTGHNRTALATNESGIVISGIRYPFLELKGVGSLRESRLTRERNSKKGKKLPVILKRVFIPWKNKVKKAQRDMWGYADISWSQIDIAITGKLEELGIPTIPIVGLRRLTEILDEKGNKIDIQTAKREGALSQEIEPAIVIRAYPIPFRISDIYPENYEYLKEQSFSNITTEKETQKRTILAVLRLLQNVDDVPENVKKSLEKENIDLYLEWLFKRIGTSVRMMHDNAIAHGALTAFHNITVDGRIMDFNEVVEDGRKQIKRDKKLFFSKTLAHGKEEAALKTLAQNMITLFKEEHGFDQRKDADYFLEIARTAYSSPKQP